MYKSFTKVCQTMLTRIQEMKEQKGTPNNLSSVDRSEQALRLVTTKRRLERTLTELMADGADDDDDHVRLLVKHLRQVSNDIKAAL